MKTEEMRFNEKKCAKCGKMFIAQFGHIYKEQSKWYCSWTCYNHRKEEKENKKEKNNEQH